MKDILDFYPASSLQQGLLFHSLLECNAGVYIEQICVDVVGELNEEAFKVAWQRVLDRHLIFRTGFVWTASKQLVQVVQSESDVALVRYDWRDKESREQEDCIEAFLRADRATDFDVKRPPLVRLALLRVGDTSWQFVWSFHHLLLDGWSTSLVIAEVMVFYEAIREGRELDLPRPRPYREYIAWLQKQDLEEAERYWRKSLEGFRMPTSLSVDRAVHGNAGVTEYAAQALHLPSELSGELQRLGRQQQLTLNTLVQGAWAILLSRYSGEQDVVFGATVSGRPADLPGVESMVGLFINTLPVRVQMSGEERMLAWLQRLQQEQSEARQYEYSPLVKVQGWSEIPRRLPLFESIVVFENYPIDASLRRAGSSLKVHEIRTVNRANYPLALVAVPGVELRLEIRYDRGRFEDEAVERMLVNLRHVLSGMAANPEQRISDVEMLGEEERELVLREWNQTGREYPRETCVQELFAAQASRTPAAVAVVYGDQELTYGELEAQSNQLAHYLQGVGVGPEVRVGLCVERSLEMVIALLAVLKAGGAYVPLDPEYPSERLAYMLADAQISVLLTQQRYTERPGGSDCKVICVDEAGLYDDQPRVVPECWSSAEQAAYVIYTSGSTGHPKGVVATHRNVVRLVRENYFAHLDADEVLLHMAPLSFDASTFEIWGALLNGGRLVMMSRGTPSLEDIQHSIEQYGITTLWLTAGLFQHMVEEQVEGLGGLRQLLSGGDALPHRQVRRLLEQAPDVRLINGYGPTETTTFACCWTVDALVHQAMRVPIGRPIANTEVYVLDDQMQPLPIGAIGELYIGGDGVTRGYLNRPGLTAERFVPDSYSGRRGARLYRTGDRVRWRVDGLLEYFGRRDGQVKVRGYRIELNEIEAILNQHEGVSQAAVVLQGDQAGEKRLVAYVVPHADKGLSSAGVLRSYLKQRLPEYMVPAVFVEMESLPLTGNGKVDRKALPDPEGQRPELEQAYEAPHTPLEEVLAGIWAQVLGLERVGVHDNFFDLGGHSLLAMQVIARASDILQTNIALRELFEFSRLEEFAGRVEELSRMGRGMTIPPLDRASREEELPLSFAQQRLWFLDQLEPGNAFYNVAAGLRLRGVLDTAALGRSLKEIVRRHEVLRTTFSTIEGRPVQVIGEADSIAFEIVDLAELQEDERESEMWRLASADAQRPFDLEHGPLLRMHLLRLSAQDHALVLTMHHIVADAWSIAVFTRELSALYAAYSSGKDSPLSELPLQYADFAVWQRGWLQGEALEAQLNYWRAQLASPPVLELPTDHPRPSIQRFRGREHRFEVPQLLSQQLMALSRREGVTLFMTLLAGFQTLLCRYSGQHDIVVGTPTANRSVSELDDLIGFFINTLPLRTQISDDLTFRQLLQRVRQVCLGAYEHQDVPFEKLVEDLQPERDLSRQPLFQAMLVLQNAPGSHLQLGELALEQFELPTTRAEFDLMLTLVEYQSGLCAMFRYAVELFDERTIVQLGQALRHVLSGMAANPEQRISDVEMLGEEERELVLREWNQTGREYPRETCVQELFAAQASRTPAAVAVVYGDQELTYGELEAQSNQLAHYLQGVGVGPEVRVGLCVERSLEMVIALLAVLKAGGAYVPLDPEYPSERLAYMLADAQISVLLTQQVLLPGLPVHWGLVICIDEAGLYDDQPRVVPECWSSAEQAAYVIYTSGSTGHPKGVVATHRNVVRLVRENYFAHLDADEVLLHMAPLSFDASTFEIWGALLNGGRLVMMSRGTPSLEDIQHSIEQYGITTLWLTAGLFQHMVEEQVEGLGGLRQLLSGGDALPHRQVRRLLEQAPDVRLINGYGPTETTTFACCWTVDALVHQAMRVPIGRPIANTEVYVLDDQMQPLPIGAIGELYIGGDGVTRGYLNRPGLTAERFVPDSYSGRRGARLYRTGDRVRWRVDGLLEYFGRRDGQVKVRGYRIELNEIEAILNQHEGVSQAAVVLQGDQAGEKRLVAYVVPHADKGLSSAGVLRSYLKQRLPEYMVPAVFVEMESLPLTGNGKVDRKALPDPEGQRPELEQAYEAPHTPLEEVLAGIWAQVLGLERVGVHDNFFDLGGDSIRSIQIAARASHAGISLTVAQLFQYQSIAQLTQVVNQSERLLTSRTCSQPFDLLSFTEDIETIAKNIEDAYPLTKLQAGLLFHSDGGEGESVYHDVFSYILQTPFDEAYFRKALQELVASHPILRTSFDVANFHEPLQLVHKAISLPLEYVDLEAMTTENQDQAIRDWLQKEKARPFVWARAPLLRFFVHKLGPERFHFGLGLHHAILDGWSVASMLVELFQRYSHHLGIDGAPLASRPATTFRDFVALELEAIKSHECRSYWVRRLADREASLLPRCSSEHSRNGGVHRVEAHLPAQLSTRLRELARRSNASIKHVYLAAHLRVLGTFTGTTKVVTGVTFNGRREEEDGDRVLGLFLNVLPFCADLLEGSWEELVGSVAVNEQEIMNYRRYPMAEIQKAMGGDKLFEVGFNFVNFHIYESLERIKELRPVETEAFEETTFVLLATFSPDTAFRSARLRLDYDRKHLTQEQVEIYLECYLKTLQVMSRVPSEGYTRPYLLAPKEWARVIEEWNRTEKEYPREFCVQELFAAQAWRTPDAVAVVYGDSCLSYRELDYAANQLGYELRALGVGPEVRVGLCVERSLEMVVGLLGILKAGGAYVPLDPHYPRERLDYMLGDAGVGVVLTTADLKPQLSAASCPVLELEGAHRLAAARREDAPRSGVTAQNAAYVIYTSGSTGKPKGVVVTHRGLANYVQWAVEAYSTRVGNGSPLFSSLSFDLTVTSLFPSLLGGRPVVIVEQEAGIENLATLLRSHRDFSLLKITPAHLRLLSDVIAGENAAGLAQSFVIGGEALRSEDLAFWQQHASDTEFINEYGPTETVVGCCIHRVRAEKDVSGDIPIGRPIWNTQVYVLDEYGEPVPVGVGGELYIGGDGVARGYLNRPGLTAERFVPDAYSGRAGARLYRTGDRARWRSDGVLEYLGRMDDQVKIRGYRIEPGEIEAVLSQQLGVRQAVVTAQQEESGSRRLVAYVVGEPGAELSGLRQSLKQHLPEYMVPSVFVEMENLPLSPNGKVDRKALPRATQTERVQGYVSPRTAAEELLAGIWSEVLGVPRIGVEDNFFELGGDSILSIQIVARAKQAGLHFNVTQLFQHQTIAGLAQVAGSQTGAEAEQGIVTGRVELTPIQSWFFEQGFVAADHWNQAVLLEIPEGWSGTRVERVMGHLQSHHDALRMRFEYVEGAWHQHNESLSNQVMVQRVDLSGVAGIERSQAIERIAAEAQASLQLSAGRVMGVVWMDLGAGQRGRLLIAVHHLVIDGVSWRILLEDLQRIWEQIEGGEAVQLPAKTTSLKSWSEGLREYAHSSEVQQELSYWLENASGEAGSLPVDTAGGANSVTSTATVEESLEEQETQALLQEAPAAYGTQINDVLLTALARTLTEWSGRSEVWVDVEGHGREEVLAGVDVSRTVGWFTTIYPVRLEWNAEQGWGEALKGVKEKLRQIPRRGIGYGLLRYLGPPEVREQLSALPGAEISFNYLGQFDQVLSSGNGLRAAPESSGSTQDQRNHRPYRVDVTGSVYGGRLHMQWSYSQNLHHRETIATLARRFLYHLRALIAHCKAPTLSPFTPSDFPLAGLDQNELDQLAGEQHDLQSIASARS